jgi:CBS domain-containing protein
MAKLRRRLRAGSRAARGWLLACALGVVTPSFAQEVEAPLATEDVGGSAKRGGRTEPPDQDRARELFVHGASLAKANRWVEALAAFEESAELLPHAKTSFNVGYSARALGRFTRARAAFRDALAQHEQGTKLTDVQVEAARDYVREAEERVVRAVVELSPQGTTVKLDGASLVRDAEGWWRSSSQSPAGGAPSEAPEGRVTLLLDPGRHLLTATSPAGVVQTLEVSPASGERPRYRIDVPSPDESVSSIDAAHLRPIGSPTTPAVASDTTAIRTVVGVVTPIVAPEPPILRDLVPLLLSTPSRDVLRPIEAECGAPFAQARTSCGPASPKEEPVSEYVARNVMTMTVHTVDEDWSLEQLARFFVDKSITGAPVVSRNGKLVGVVSTTDLARAATERAAPPPEEHDYFARSFAAAVSPDELAEVTLVRESGRTVRDLMTPAIFDVSPDTKVAEIAQMMVKGRIHRVFVTEDKKIVGVVSALDLLRLLAG